MSTAKFVVVGEHRMFNGASQATVIVDRENGLITVRPYRQHKSYQMRLADVAESVIVRCIRAELAESKPKRKFLAKRSVL